MRNTRRSPASRTIKLLTATVLCIITMCRPVPATINYNLLYHWSYQPENVKWNLVSQNTSINVVPELPWKSPELYDTYAYTTMNVVPGTLYVSSIDMYIEEGMESTLTHEVGHCISNAGHSVYWWCYRPEFIEIWQQERMNCPLLIGQGLTDIREYFACAYDTYIRYPQILKRTCPMTYNYITVVLQNT